MKITKVSKTVKSSTNAKRKSNITASTAADMLDAFEAKLAEFGVSAACDVKGSTGDPEMDSIMTDERAVEIYGEDWHDRYQDVGGGFGGSTDDIYSLGEIKEYWNKNNIGDPSLEVYRTFEDWWRDTRDNFMIEA